MMIDTATLLGYQDFNFPETKGQITYYTNTMLHILEGKMFAKGVFITLTMN